MAEGSQLIPAAGLHISRAGVIDLGAMIMIKTGPNHVLIGPVLRIADRRTEVKRF